MMFTVYATLCLLRVWLAAMPARLAASTRPKRHRAADGVSRVLTGGRHHIGAVAEAVAYRPRFVEGATSHHATLLSPVAPWSAVAA